MKIGAANQNINLNFSNRGQSLKSPSENSMSPLEKEQAKLKNQIKEIQQSNLSKESKDAAIKEIQQKLSDIDKQIIEEKETKAKEAEESQKSKESESEKQKVEKDKDKDENIQTVDKDVVLGLVSASTHKKVANVAYGEYRKALFKGDMVTAKRALSYSMSEIRSAFKSLKKAQNVTKAYKKHMDDFQNENKSKEVSGQENNKQVDGMKQNSDETKQSTDSKNENATKKVKTEK